MKMKYYLIKAVKYIGDHDIEFCLLTKDDQNKTPLLIIDKIFLNWFDDDSMRNSKDYHYKRRKSKFSIVVDSISEITHKEYESLYAHVTETKVI